jgi:hypothetical protein
MSNNGIEFFLSLLRVLIQSRRDDIKAHVKNNKKIWIIGGGPSGKSSIKKLIKYKDEDDFFLVNDMYHNVDCKSLNPKFCIIADPDYWSDERFASLGDAYIRGISKMKTIETCFVPNKARNTKFAKLLESEISVAYFNSTRINGPCIFTNPLYEIRAGMPTLQNILVGAIMVAIWLGYSRIGIVGADHDWHKSLVLDQKNILHVEQLHSYSKINNSFSNPFYKPVKSNDSDKNTFSVSEIFHAWYLLHKSYEMVELFARKKSIDIVNYSEITLIDAFKRGTL